MSQDASALSLGGLIEAEQCRRCVSKPLVSFVKVNSYVLWRTRLSSTCAVLVQHLLAECQ